jgi:hypothetical protein
MGGAHGWRCGRRPREAAARFRQVAASPTVTVVAPQIAAAAEALAAFAAHSYRGCLIGGLALQRWGEPRFTQDADLTVLAPFGSETKVVDDLLRVFRPRVAEARTHALTYRVLMVKASNGVSLDISLAALPFEEEVLTRASSWRSVGDVSIITCSAEDLIIYKLVAGRPQDVVDIRGIVHRQGDRLDLARIRHWGAQFADLKEDPDLLRPFEDALRQNPPDR